MKNVFFCLYPKPDPGEPNQCGSGSVKLLCRSQYFAAVHLQLQIWLMFADVPVAVRVQIIE